MSTDIVEKLEFPRRSQLRRPAGSFSMEISLRELSGSGTGSFCVRPSLSPCCVATTRGDNAFPRESGIVAVPQFPTFSTISTFTGHSGSRCRHCNRGIHDPLAHGSSRGHSSGTPALRRPSLLAAPSPAQGSGRSCREASRRLAHPPTMSEQPPVRRILTGSPHNQCFVVFTGGVGNEA